jgi:hypothetical protein
VKTRNGFVSNSSNSSFIIGHRPKYKNYLRDIGAWWYGLKLKYNPSFRAAEEARWEKELEEDDKECWLKEMEARSYDAAEIQAIQESEQGDE